MDTSEEPILIRGFLPNGHMETFTSLEHYLTTVLDLSKKEREKFVWQTTELLPESCSKLGWAPEPDNLNKECECLGCALAEALETPLAGTLPASNQGGIALGSCACTDPNHWCRSSNEGQSVPAPVYRVCSNLQCSQRARNIFEEKEEMRRQTALDKYNLREELKAKKRLRKFLIKEEQLILRNTDEHKGYEERRLKFERKSKDKMEKQHAKFISRQEEKRRRHYEKFERYIENQKRNGNVTDSCFCKYDRRK